MAARRRQAPRRLSLHVAAGGARPACGAGARQGSGRAGGGDAWRPWGVCTVSPEHPVTGWRCGQETLGLYCPHLLADYITLAAAPSSPAASADGGGGGGGGGLAPAAAAALRQGAYELYGACSPAEARAPCSGRAGGSRGCQCCCSGRRERLTPLWRWHVFSVSV